jgi:hypothetical protein
VNSTTRQELYHGLLLALRARCDFFVAYGSRFHDAFEKALRANREKAFSDLIADLLEDTDAAFGVYHGAGEMVLEGMTAMFLMLEAPGFETARFKISKSGAHKELDEFEYAGAYREMAAALYDAMRPHG